MLFSAVFGFCFLDSMILFFWISIEISLTFWPLSSIFFVQPDFKEYIYGFSAIMSEKFHKVQAVYGCKFPRKWWQNGENLGKTAKNWKVSGLGKNFGTKFFCSEDFSILANKWKKYSNLKPDFMKKYFKNFTLKRSSPFDHSKWVILYKNDGRENRGTIVWFDLISVRVH